jgi:class 3 adenylate cyclase
MGGTALLDATSSVSDGLEVLIEPTLLYFHRKSWQRAIRRDFLIHMLEELGIENADSARGALTRAVLFVDLSGFTPLTSAMGDLTATDILQRFSTLVRRAARQYDGMTIKQIGDGLLLVFLDVASAVRAACTMARQLAREQQFPAMHAGIHFGPVLYREGDYFGTTVNVAARILAEADRNELVITADARRCAGELLDLAFHPLGVRTVKGLTEPIELYRVEDATAAANERLVDPVCGMQLGPNEVAARMTIGDDEHVFCSARCMGIFVTATREGTKGSTNDTLS